MDPTTLFTFQFRAAPDNNPHSVELLGSWDNFATAHAMQHDRRRGAGSWSGCFRFDHIIFDGEVSMNRLPRSGGLKQGGTYWYYFRLDHDVEAYADTQETVTTCPLLPGQRMNVIEVPIEIVPPPTRSRSACGGIDAALADRWPHTLDPSSKFASLQPPPVSKVHARCISELALHIDTTPIKPRDSVHSTYTYRPSPASDSSSSLYSQSDCRSTFSIRSGSPVYDASRVQTPEELRGFSNDAETTEEDDRWIDGSIDGDSNDHSFEPLETPQLPPFDYAPSSSAISVQNIQFYGSRPSTSISEHQWRPRVYSVPKRSNSDLQQHVVHETPRRPRPSNHETPFDPDSPSYSIDTVSTPGVNTPPRLSMGYSRRGSEQSDDSYNPNDEPITTPPPPSRAPPPPPGPPRTSRSTPSRRDPRNFFGYALPAAAVESAQSLMTKISAHTPRLSISSIRFKDKSADDPSPLLPLALPSLEATTTHSLVDDIFSELGYA